MKIDLTFFIKIIPVFILLFFYGCGLSGIYIKDNFKSVVEKPDNQNIAERILLIGDAGQPASDVREPVLEALEVQASLLPKKTTVLFLGDNIYPYGLYDANSELRKISESRLNEQIKVVEDTKAAGIFVPGNHDWDQGGPDGWTKIIDQNLFITSKKIPNLQMLPKDGCPGPSIVDLNGVRLVILDTQWWLHENDKPDEGNSTCSPITENEIVKAVDEAIKSAGKKFVIVAAHHPLNSYGSHGGFFDWQHHVFPLLSLNKYLWIPLPIIGSLYPLARNLGISNQDMSSAAYKNLINKLEPVIAKYKNVAYAAGHDHSIQVLEGAGDNYYLISGFGTSVHNESITTGDNTVFANASQGFMQVDILKNGMVRLGIHQVDEKSGNWGEVFAMWLYGNENDGKKDAVSK